MSEALILVPFGAAELLALDLEQLEAARQRARELLPSPATADPLPAPEQLLTDEGLAKVLDVPASQIGTLARQGRIPSLLVGKYRRYRYSEVLAALAGPYTVRHTAAEPQARRNQRLGQAVSIALPRRARGSA